MPFHDRGLGERYFERGAVFDIESGEGWLSARVEGTAPVPYNVRVQWNPEKEGPVLWCRCSCPRFEQASVCKHLWAALLSFDHAELGFSVPGLDPLKLKARDAGRQAQGRGGPVPEPMVLEPWEFALRHLEHGLRRPPPLSRHHWDSPPAEVWYAIDVPESQDRGALFLKLYQRREKQHGGLTVPKPLSISMELIEALPEAEHRDLLELFLAMKHQSGYGVASRRYVEWATVPAPLHHTLLPRLAATGRLTWLSRDRPSLEHPLEWQPEPWTDRLRLERYLSGAVRLQGELVRGDATLPLSDPLLVLPSLVVFEDSLAPFEPSGGFAWVPLLRQRKSIDIPASSVDAGLARMWSLPSLPPVEGPEELVPKVASVEPTPKLRIQTAPGNRPSKPRLMATLSFDYGGLSVDADTPGLQLFQPDAGRLVERQPDVEARAVQRLEDLKLRPLESDRPHELGLPEKRMVRVAERLLAEGWSVEADGKALRGARRLSFRVTSGIDWLGVNGRAGFGSEGDGADVDLVAILQAVRRRERFVTLGDGSRGILPKRWLARFESLSRLASGERAGEGEDDGELLEFLPSQALLLDLLLEDAADRGLTVDADASFRALRERLARPSEPSPKPEPRGFRGELRPYQRVGLGWFESLAEAELGGCLADDMGLGKTVQVLALLQARRLRPIPADEKLPSLVVAPRSVVYNWIEEAERFAPRLRVADGSGPDRKEVFRKLDEVDVVVTTYGIVRRDVKRLAELHFDYVVLDEAQMVKNPATQGARAVRRLRSEHRLALTGTPIENHIGELWSLLDFLNPGLLGRLGSGLVEKSTGSEPLSERELATIARAARPFLLRRRKEEVLADLPPKTEQTLWCDLGEQQRFVYNELARHYRKQVAERIQSVGLAKSGMLVLEALLRLRQAACHPALIDAGSKIASSKLDLLMEQLDELRQEGHKAIVFSQFTKLLAQVQPRLEAAGLGWEQLDGSTRNRKAKVERFQDDPECAVFLVSLKAGGTGLNLTAASYVFLLDPWWNPAVEAQAIDRTHRIGQQHPVFAYRLIARDTVEERILALQAKKRDLADAILGEDARTLRGLSEDEIEELLR